VSKQPLAIRWRLALRDDDRVLSSPKLLGHTLSTYADNGSHSAFVGLPTLARNCGFSYRTAHRARKSLERFGYLDLQHRSGQTSVSTLRLPLTPMTGVPLTPATRTPVTRVTRTLNNSDGGAAKSSAPPFAEDDCAGCGQRLPLVKDDLYCEGCAR
jgi:hypothetical protein